MQSERLDARATRPKPGDILAGKYRIEGLIGEGGMGSVYAARNLGTGKRVALKWVLAERSADQEMLTRFQREARAAGRVDHPNVVSVYDVGQHGPSTFLVMELLSGYPLSKVLESGPLPQDVAIGIVMPAMRGISAAHAQGVIHRDLKPDNIFLCLAPDGSPRETKVLDFGVSKMTDEVRSGLSVTKTGAVVGTPYYMSPEQVRGMRDVDARIDVYAMGVILYEMLARRPPFVANSYSALVLEIATGKPPSLLQLRPDLDRGLVDVLERAMARDRDERYPDIASFARALEPFGDGTKFEPDRPDWTARITTGTGEDRRPFRSDDWTGPGTGPRESGVATLPASQVPAISLEDAETAARLPSGVGWEVDVPTDAGSGEDAIADATSPEAAIEPVERSVPTLAQAPPPRRWGRAALVLAGIVGVVVLLVLLSSGGEPEVPDAATEPASTEAPGPAAEPQRAPEREEPAAEAAAEQGPEAAGDVPAQEAPAVADDEASRAAPPAEAVSAPSAERDTVRRATERRRRAARERARRAAAANAEPTDTMAETMRSTMRGPRAGSLSLDDF